MFVLTVKTSAWQQKSLPNDTFFAIFLHSIYTFRLHTSFLPFMNFTNGFLQKMKIVLIWKILQEDIHMVRILFILLFKKIYISSLALVWLHWWRYLSLRFRKPFLMWTLHFLFSLFFSIIVSIDMLCYSLPIHYALRIINNLIVQILDRSQFMFSNQRTPLSNLVL